MKPRWNLNRGVQPCHDMQLVQVVDRDGSNCVRRAGAIHWTRGTALMFYRFVPEADDCFFDITKDVGTFTWRDSYGNSGVTITNKPIQPYPLAYYEAMLESPL